MAAILTDGRRTFVGLNQLKTHPLQAKFSSKPGCIYLHAEIDALAKAFRPGTDFMIDRSAIYIARIFKNGQPALAKPCPGCLSALNEFGIKEIYWTT